MFLWQWSRRRVVGPLAVALGGALVGAAGGVVFALILFGDFGTDNGSVAAFLALLEQGAAALVLAVPAFAVAVAMAMIVAFIGFVWIRFG